MIRGKVRHQLIYAAALPPPGQDALALGEKRYQAFIDSVARTLAKGVDHSVQTDQGKGTGVSQDLSGDSQDREMPRREARR